MSDAIKQLMKSSILVKVDLGQCFKQLKEFILGLYCGNEKSSHRKP